ncbi:hypothetical protein OAA06_00795 [bacterium]|nr:hypothetical protein [bacterium]
MKLSLRYILLFAITIIYSSSIFAQTEPIWIESGYREINYPPSAYYTAFGDKTYIKNEDPNKVIASIEERLKLQIASEIKVRIKGNQENIITQENGKLNSKYSQTASSSTDIEIVGVSFDTYNDIKKKQVYVFAHVSRGEIIGYYKSSLSMHMQQIEGFVSSAQLFLSQSEKSKARAEYKKVLPLISKVEDAQSILNAVDRNSNENSLQIQKTIDIKNHIAQELKNLEHATFIFISCHSELFGNQNQLLENKIKAQLAEHNCSFVTDQSQADWVIDIKATARKYNNPHDTYFSYVDASVSLTKAYDNKHIYQDQISQKGGSVINYNEAAKKAFKDIAINVSKNLLKWIEK